MKTIRLFLSTLIICFSFQLSAQQGINYKALVKDNSGNVVANDLIVIQFTILKGAGLTNVYLETHTPTTDANGFVIVNIGEGTTSDDFSAIDWGADDHYLNVQINTGGGLVDMGTTQFMAVPYAINANVANNVSGLEAIDEGNGIGWRLIGKDSLNYGSLGDSAVDLSYSDLLSNDFGATGLVAFASGYRTIASESVSTAMGNSTTASVRSEALWRCTKMIFVIWMISASPMILLRPDQPFQRRVMQMEAA